MPGEMKRRESDAGRNEAPGESLVSLVFGHELLNSLHVAVSNHRRSYAGTQNTSL